jgi:hypothetical protein
MLGEIFETAPMFEANTADVGELFTILEPPFV